MHRLGFTIGWPYIPHLAQYYVKRGPAAQLNLSDSKRLTLIQQQFAKSAKTDHPKDVEAFRNVNNLKLFLRTAREAYAQDWDDGPGQDGWLASRDFGFRLEDIKHWNPALRVRLWYGKHDTHVPATSHGEGIAKGLGHIASLRVEDETHASLALDYKSREKIFRDFVDCL